MKHQRRQGDNYTNVHTDFNDKAQFAGRCQVVKLMVSKRFDQKSNDILKEGIRRDGASSKKTVPPQKESPHVAPVNDLEKLVV